jgi:hypothetical protein
VIKVENMTLQEVQQQVHQKSVIVHSKLEPHLQQMVQDEKFMFNVEFTTTGYLISMQAILERRV